MKRTALGYRQILPLLGLISILLLAACKPNPFEIRSNPANDPCVESLLAVHVETGDGSKEGFASMTLTEFQSLAMQPGNLERAIGYRKYILHFYRRLADRDEEVSPVKFPLFWNIDSTKTQTEGTYLLEFADAKTLKIAFHCDECAQIDPRGHRLPAKRSDFETEFNSNPTATHSTEDWSFSIRPRKVNIAEEIGKTWLVRIESRETYLEEAKTRIQPDSGHYPQTFALRFSDPLEYRATTFVKELGIAMALSDQEARKSIIDARLAPLETQIDSLKAEIEALLSANNQEAELQAPHAELVKLEREKTNLQIEKFSVLPRILVVSPGIPCKR